MEKLIKINSDNFIQKIDVSTNELNFIDIDKGCSNIDITFNFYESCDINFSSFTWNNDKKISIKLNLLKDDCVVNFFFNSLTINNYKSEITVDGVNVNDVNNNHIDIQISGIVNSQKSQIKCLPMYHLKSNKVDAKHGLIIGTFNDDEIFSLLTKGIEISDAKTMLIWSKFNKTLNFLPQNEKDDYYKFILEKWGKDEK